MVAAKKSPSPDRQLADAIAAWQAGMARLTDAVIVAALAVAEDRQRLARSESIKHGKANLRLNGRHQGGLRPFGYRFGKIAGPGRAADLIPDPVEQQAILDIAKMRSNGMGLMKIRDAMRARGHQISHQTVANLLERQALSARAKAA